MHVEMRWHSQDGVLLPVALWCPGPGYRMISSGVAGGGIGLREWVLNAQVPTGYARVDPAVHVAELAAGLGLAGEGVGLLTAARVTDAVQCDDEGVRAAATVGLRVPAWAAVPPGTADRALAAGLAAGHHQHHRLGSRAAPRRGLRQRRHDCHRGQVPGRAGGGIPRYRDGLGRDLHRGSGVGSSPRTSLGPGRCGARGSPARCIPPCTPARYVTRRRPAWGRPGPCRLVPGTAGQGRAMSRWAHNPEVAGSCKGLRRLISAGFQGCMSIPG